LVYCSNPLSLKKPFLGLSLYCGLLTFVHKMV
jgi:hypothetical protein